MKTCTRCNTAQEMRHFKTKRGRPTKMCARCRNRYRHNKAYYRYVLMPLHLSEGG